MSGDDFNHKTAIETASAPDSSKATLQKLDRLLQAPPKNRFAGYFWLLFILLAIGRVVGWIVWTQVMLPMQMAKLVKPNPPAAVPLGYPEAATIADTADYAATLDSRQSITLQPKVAGQVTALYVKSGDPVRAGDLVAQVDALEQQAQMTSRKAAVETAKADIDAARTDVTTAQENLKALQARLTAEESNVQLAQQEYERFRSLQKEGATSQQLLDQKLSALKIAQANLRQAQAQIQAQKSAISRAQDAVTRSERAMLQLQTEVSQVRVELQNYKVMAPFTGIVGEVTAKLGDMVTTASPLLTLTENRQLEIDIPIPLERSAQLKPGLTVQLMDDQGQVIQTGNITYIAPTVSAATQSILAKAQFQNQNDALRTAQFVRARVIWSQRPGVLVPTTAISRLGGQDFVFVARPYSEVSCPTAKVAPNAESQAEPNAGPAIPPDQWVAAQQIVKLGKIINNSQQVLQGLQTSDRIVTAGILQLQHCAPIQAAPLQAAP